MNVEQDIQLTSGELSFLWGTYLSDSMSVCVFKYFLQHIEDPNIKTLVEQTLETSQQSLESVRKIFNTEKIQMPHGFTEDDVNLKAKRLYSDVFCIFFVKNMISLNLKNLAVTLPFMYRKDISSYVTKNLSLLINLNSDINRILLEKRQPVRPPFVPYPTETEFIQKQSFILDILDRRPLLAVEVNSLHGNSLTNAIGTCISTSFAQVSNTKEVSEYFLRGKEISTKHIKVFSDYLEKQSLPISLPLTSNQDVTNSEESPFSEKLMMYLFLIMNRAGVNNYGLSIASSMRSDLVVDFTRLVSETLKFTEDGVNIMIKNNWLERPPLASYRAKG